MDFCHPCRRHLNGALACPGCGTPAETPHARQQAGPADGAPVLPDAGDAYGDGDGDRPGGEGADAGEEPAADAVPRGRRADRRRGGRPEGPEGEDDGVGQSRRDRKAAAHRRRRNRTLLIVAGFVLAAGGLSLAELGLDAPAPKPRPAVAGGESVDGGSDEVEPSASAGGTVPRAGVPSRSPGPAASGSASASVSASASAPEDKESEGAEEETAEATTSSAPAETPTAGEPTTQQPPQDPPETDAPADPDPTTEEPDPEPEPSQTCKKFLWWCS